MIFKKIARFFHEDPKERKLGCLMILLVISVIALMISFIPEPEPKPKINVLKKARNGVKNIIKEAIHEEIEEHKLEKNEQ